MKATQEKIDFVRQKASVTRKLIIKMLAEAKSGHPGGSLSCVEILCCLYFDILNYNPKDIQWRQRDRFHLSKGHACPCWYAVLCQAGYFEEKHLYTLRKLGSILQGHPDPLTPGVEISSGSLGQGLSVSLGMSLSLRLDSIPARVYCVMGDGELQEGNIWEAAMASAHFRADNLCGIVDCNGFQIDGRIEEVMNIEPLADKWRSFGWHVIQCDGHNIASLLEAFYEAEDTKGRPTVILASTVKGKGVSFMEHVVDFHGRAPTEEETKIALEELSKE